LGRLEKNSAGTAGPTFIDGSVNSNYWYYAIGAINGFGGGFPGPNSGVNLVELYIR